MRIEVPARTTGGPRWLVIGRMGGRHWSAVVAYREDRIRIISVRRARDEERFRAVNVATLDRRHFSVVRPSHAAAFTLLP
jgi:uncharacterized DUF497 family protein